uniref:Uncharacterized protein n=1 Tax=Romanomermis culicivorax TaxID=13658 RepID=A0A915HIK9_ROMCU
MGTDLSAIILKNVSSSFRKLIKEKDERHQPAGDPGNVTSVEGFLGGARAFPLLANVEEV